MTRFTNWLMSDHHGHMVATAVVTFLLPWAMFA